LCINCFQLGIRVVVGEHKVGCGSVFVVDANLGLTGTLGEGPGRNRERVLFSVHSLGISAVEGLCVNDGSFIGRVSVADASLSLSLSLGQLSSRR
jgi:hypothetical protein